MKISQFGQVAWVGVFCTALSAVVSAQTNFPLRIEFVPSPVAGQPFQIRVTNQTPCDSIEENAPVSVPRFVQEGNVVRLTTVGVQSFSPFCLDPLRTAVFGAPPLAAGNYTLELQYQNPTIVPPFLYIRQSVPLVVSLGSPGAPVPLGNTGLWIALGLIFGTIGLSRLRRP